uniref:bifunctional metallophosphatase/5'-nucleotidase n=1 Tax=uncultured Caulobacter sp. TaxID=158749 RepID=UPI002600CB7D|nr:bifunctional metallophosphatase/5'-nucleotidase [uncultured Caulobacter sp.]
MSSHNITILQINDLHGYLEPHPELIRAGDQSVFTTLGGLARIATLYRQVRDETNGAVLALDNGDTFHGTFVAVQSKGAALAAPMNALGIDAMTAHWEFAYGPAGFKKLAAQLNYPVLAINCYDKSTGELVFKPYEVFERGGLRIGVIGMACPIVDKTMPPSFSEGIRFTIGREELPGWIERLRDVEAVDLVVVLSHLGFPQDVKLAREVDGIDVLVSGHTHNRMAAPVIENGAIIFQSGCHGAFIGRLDLEVRDRKVVAHTHRLIPIDESLAEEPAMRSLVEEALAPHRTMLNEVVGHTKTGLDRYSMLSASMDDVLLEAIATAAGVDIAFSNGWRYGAPIPPGPVTMNDLWNMIPMNPPVSVVDVTGSEICALLEENLERAFAADPFDQMGGYVKRCRGLNLYIKVENPRGRRIDRLFVAGRPVEPDMTYRVAFVTAQGVPSKYGRNRRDLDIRAIDALRSYFAEKTPLRLGPQRTVMAV